MSRYVEHEVLDVQEHIRGEAATAQVCRQFAQIALDPDLRAFCEQEARISATNAQKLMSLLQQGQGH